VDLRLWRDAAGVLAQRNSGSAQTFRVYGTTTGPKHIQLQHTGINGVIALTGGGYINLAGGNVGIGGDPTTNTFYVNGTGYFTGNVTVLGATTSVVGLTASGHISAATKSFLIPNPTGGKLQYGVLEGPEHSVFVRGRTNTGVIYLPTEWEWLVDPASVTVSITPVGKPFDPYVLHADNTHVVVDGVEGEYFYTIFGTRVDVPKLEVNL
jgi:hypothetical protein